MGVMKEAPAQRGTRPTAARFADRGPREFSHHLAEVERIRRGNRRRLRRMVLSAR